MDLNELKTAVVDHKVINPIKQRWSPRSFSSDPIVEEDLHQIMEAARWSASSMNEQPWQYRYAFNGDESFLKIWEGLLPGNQPWTKNAAILIVSSYVPVFSSSGKANKSALHDLGMANAHMVLQAQSIGIYTHMIAGFDEDKIREDLNIPAGEELGCILALGFRDDPDKLSSPYLEREKAKRVRKPIDQIAHRLS